MGRATGRITSRTVLLAVASLVLAACASPHSTTSAGTSSTTSIRGAAHASTPVPGATEVPYNKYKNARLDVSVLGACTRQANGAWILRGTVINPDPVNPTGFSIVVDFVHEPGGTVLDTVIVRVPPVEPKNTATWHASWSYAGSGLTCLVRQAQVT
jgi:hypothetical protein